MKKITLISLIATAAACSLLNSANVGPKMIVTCENVSGSMTLTSQEATEFVKDVKNLKKDNPVCLKNEEAKKFCAKLIKSASKKCSAKAEL